MHSKKNMKYFIQCCGCGSASKWKAGPGSGSPTIRRLQA